MDLIIALLLLTATAIGYAAGYVVGWTDRRTRDRSAR
jgi:ABC-type dipeptide/oligopeptide/nickel transport system permease subunit